MILGVRFSPCGCSPGLQEVVQVPLIRSSLQKVLEESEDLHKDRRGAEGERRLGGLGSEGLGGLGSEGLGGLGVLGSGGLGGLGLGGLGLELGSGGLGSGGLGGVNVMDRVRKARVSMG